MRLVRNDLNIHELRELGLRRLQYLFFILFLLCIIAIVWLPTMWAQIAGTAVLLLIAGAACKSGRER
jgi:energy-coupling factor transporter transmembrane protein EcfT